MGDHFHNSLAWLIDHTAARIILDITSVVAISSAIAGWLPPIAAILGIGWYCVLFWDRFFGRDREK